MKKVLFLVAAAAAMLAACNIPQIQRDDVSFEGLKTFYVEAPQNGGQLFDRVPNAKECDDVIVAEISSNLENKGYKRVPDKSQAQMIFVPVWSVSIESTDEVAEMTNFAIMQNGGYNPTPFGIDQYCATLEIQAFLKGDDRWGWRGFSPIQTKANNITTAMLKNQVTWALEYFPPELNPHPISSLFSSSKVTDEEIKQKNQQQQELKAELEKKRQQAYKNAVERARQKANAGRPEGAVPVEPTKQQIAQEQKLETISDINKAFDRAIEERSKKSLEK